MADLDDDMPLLPHRDGYDMNSKIMLTAIISLSLVVAVVIVLHVYARCALRRRARRRHLAFLGRIHSIGLATSGEPPPKTGLDPMVINSLPTFVFKQKNDVVAGSNYYYRDDDDDTSTECAVCLSMLAEEEVARLLPNCKHIFHKECIDKWLASHSTCPICRTEAEPRLLVPEPREGPAVDVVVGDRAIDSLEETSDVGGGAGQLASSAKIINANGSTSRLTSFRGLLSGERSMRRVQLQSRDQEDHDFVVQDLETQ